MSNTAKNLQKSIIELGDRILLFNVQEGLKPNYSGEVLPLASVIFMSALMDSMYDLQDKERMKLADREAMAQSCGEELRKLIKTYTNMDPHDFFQKIQKLKQD